MNYPINATSIIAALVIYLAIDAIVASAAIATDTAMGIVSMTVATTTTTTIHVDMFNVIILMDMVIIRIINTTSTTIMIPAPTPSFITRSIILFMSRFIACSKLLEDAPQVNLPWLVWL